MSNENPGSQAGSSSTPSGTTAGRGTGNRGRGRGFTGGRHGNRQNDQRSRNRSSAATSSTFKGATKELAEYIFGVHEGYSGAKQYTDNIKQLKIYAYRNCDTDLGQLFSTMPATPTIEKPKPLSEEEKKDETEVELYKYALKDYASQLRKLKQEIKKMYAVVLGQCTEAMITKLKALPNYESINNEGDCRQLLIEIRNITYAADSREDAFVSTTNSASKLYKLYQDRQTLEDYYNTWINLSEVVKHKGGAFIGEELIIAILEENKGCNSSSGAIDQLRLRARIVDDEQYKLYKQAKETAEERYLAALFIKGLGNSKYGKLKADLANQCSWGNNQYPKTVTAAYEVALQFKTGNDDNRPARDQQLNRGQSVTGVSFYQSENQSNGRRQTVAGTDGQTWARTLCYECGNFGHRAIVCPEAANEGEDATTTTPSNNESTGGGQTGVSHCIVSEVTDASASYGFSFTQAKRGQVDQGWILLDSQSTHSIFSNPKLLTNIRHCGHTGLTMYSNGGSQSATMIGEFNELGLTVWFNPDSLANILALKEVREKYRVTLDTELESSFEVSEKNGGKTVLRFEECGIGLYRCDMNNQLKISQTDTPYTLLNTVEGNKSHFTRREIKQAENALTIYRKIGRPSQKRFYDILEKNQLINCPITAEDAKRAFYIYGPDVATLRGKMTRNSANAVSNYVPVALPSELKRAYMNIDLAADIFYVQGRAHQHTISRRIKFRTAERLQCKNNPKKAELLESIKKVIRLYEARKFTVQQVIADNQYECIREDILPMLLTIVGAGEHVGDIERSIRTVKEYARTTTQGLPFKRYPGLLVDSIVKKAIIDLNSFPAEDGASDTMSPRTIVTGLPKMDINDYQLEFGQYCEVYSQPDPTNRQDTRSVGGIALIPSNSNGGYYFMSLATGQRIHSYAWRELPMTTDTIRAVDRLGKKEKQPIIRKGGLTFEWAPGIPIIADDEDPDDLDDDYTTDDDDDNDDDDLDPDDYDDDNLSIIDDDDHEVMHREDDHSTGSLSGDPEDDQRSVGTSASLQDNSDNDNNSTEDAEEDEIANEDEEAGNNNPNDEEERSAPPAEERSAEERSAEETNIAEERSDNTNIAEERSDNTTRSGRRSRRHNYKEANKKGFTFLNTVGTEGIDKTLMAKTITGVIFAQVEPEDATKRSYYYKQGVKVLGDDAIKAIIKEAKQLDEKRVFKPLAATSLSQDQKNDALRSITMVTKKRCGRIKGRTCADGRKQRGYVSKLESASPTVSLEALMAIILTAAHEERQVMTADIAGAYLNADMNDFVTMKFDGDMVDYMVEANPELYSKFVSYENGKKVLYVQLLKALYGCIQSALLWYKMLTEHLIKLKYKLNPYDQCVANRIINGTQCTIAYYVDDLMATHKESKVLMELKEQLEKEYGEMSVTTGDEHVYLGMDIKFNRKNKTAEILMTGHIDEALEKFEKFESLDGKPVNTPAKKDLFEINEDAEKLEGEKKDAFHSITALLLYIGKRPRHDIQPAISFLCTRPTVADVDDWRKLKRLLQYLKHTRNLPLIIGADTLTAFKTFVDVAYGVHNDMRSHTGGTMTFGRGAISSKSSKQKLNVKSSTEGEIVGMSDYLTFPIWFKYFLGEQGYAIEDSPVYQDNQSAMKIEENGLTSCGQKSKHMHSRFFYIKDRLKENKITVEYCPTEKMLADFFTKPLQGSLFRKFRDVILGHKHVNTLQQVDHPSTSKERVGSNEKVEIPTEQGKIVQITTEGRNPKKSYAEIVKGKSSNE